MYFCSSATRITVGASASRRDCHHEIEEDVDVAHQAGDDHGQRHHVRPGIQDQWDQQLVPGNDEHDDPAGRERRRRQRQHDVHEGAEPRASVDARRFFEFGGIVSK